MAETTTTGRTAPGEPPKPDAKDGKDAKAKGKTNGAEKPEQRSKTLGTKQSIEQLLDDARAQLQQLAPLCFESVEDTEGGEKCSISLKAVYNPGGAKSKARFDVDATLSIPAPRISRDVVLHEGKDGKQLKMILPFGS